jgi:transcriptional regulator with XRE-family HTH domain
MPKRRRDALAVEATLRNREQLARAGLDVRSSRKRRRLSQRQLGELVSLGRSTISDIERGLGGGHTLETWQRLAVALGRPLRLEFGRDPREAPADAGHLALQELVLSVARRAGWRGSFEVPTRPLEPWRSTDVGLIDERRGRLVLVECWNTIGDIGAAARSTNRKLAETTELASARGMRTEPKVGSCWVVRASARNRDLVRTYPEVFARRFPGSSHAWLAALTRATDPPIEPGLIWASADARRLFPLRRR